MSVWVLLDRDADEIRSSAVAVVRCSLCQLDQSPVTGNHRVSANRERRTQRKHWQEPYSAQRRPTAKTRPQRKSPWTPTTRTDWYAVHSGYDPALAQKAGREQMGLLESQGEENRPTENPSNHRRPHSSVRKRESGLGLQHDPRRARQCRLSNL